MSRFSGGAPTALLALSMLLTGMLSACGGGGGGSVSNTSGSVVTPATTAVSATAAASPLVISGKVPAGATQIRVGGDDIDGVEIFSTTVAATVRFVVQLPTDATTVHLDYFDANANLVARYAQSAGDDGEIDFSAGITDPPLQILSASGSARDSGPASFVFLGCNRLSGGDATATGDATVQRTTANVAQLNQDCTEILKLSPKPRYVFLCGDIVQGKKQDVVNLSSQLSAWTTLDVLNRFKAADIKVVVLPGNHEMCWKGQQGNDEVNDIPLKAGGDLFASKLRNFIITDASLKVQPGPSGTAGAPDVDGVMRDESKLSYTFQDGDSFYMILNTDSYVGVQGLSDNNPATFDASKLNNREIPINWIRARLKAANNDPTVKNIFVFGHRPVVAVGDGEPGEGPEQGIADATWTLQGDTYVRTPGKGTKEWQLFYKMLNDPSGDGTTPTKVRGYLCAHAHLWSDRDKCGSLQSTSPNGISQIVSGNGGSAPDNYGAACGSPTPGGPFRWFGYSVVRIESDGAVDLDAWGRDIPATYYAQDTRKWRQVTATQREERRLYP